MLKENCKFCLEMPINKPVIEYNSVYAIYDSYPVTDDHLLIIPKRHVVDFFELSHNERRDADSLLFLLRNEIIEKDPDVTGFNIGINCGASAGQTIMHAHIHLIPRREGDCVDPRGGVRCVILEKMKY